MKNKSYGWALILLLVIFGIAAILAYRHNHARTISIPSTTNLAVYQNDTYGYVFSYPPSYTVRVVSPENAIIGEATSSAFVTYAEVRVATSSNATYNDFVIGQMKQLCTHSAGSSCADVASAAAYTTETGLAGVKYYLNLVTKDGTTQRFGPLYAFNLGGSVPGARSAALIVYRPLEAAGAVETFSAEDIARKLELTRPNR
jgi:hypothetical protein